MRFVRSKTFAASGERLHPGFKRPCLAPYTTDWPQLRVCEASGMVLTCASLGAFGTPRIGLDNISGARISTNGCADDWGWTRQF